MSHRTASHQAVFYLVSSRTEAFLLSNKGPGDTAQGCQAVFFSVATMDELAMIVSGRELIKYPYHGGKPEYACSSHLFVISTQGQVLLWQRL